MTIPRGEAGIGRIKLGFRWPQSWIGYFAHGCFRQTESLDAAGMGETVSTPPIRTADPDRKKSLRRSRINLGFHRWFPRPLDSALCEIPRVRLAD